MDFHTCPTCEKHLPRTTEYFHKSNKQKTYGLNSTCKICVCARSKRQRTEQDPEKTKTYKRLWAQKSYQEDPGRHIRNVANYRNRHRKQLRARDKKRREEKRETLNATERARYKKTPAIRQAATHRHMARKRRLPADFTATDWTYALQYWGYACAICGQQEGLFGVGLSLEHWIPLSSPHCTGTIPGNILPTCFGRDGCNNSKSSREPQDWLIDQLGARCAKKKLAAITAFFKTVRQIPTQDETAAN